MMNLAYPGKRWDRAKVMVEELIARAGTDMSARSDLVHMAEAKDIAPAIRRSCHKLRALKGIAVADEVLNELYHYAKLLDEDLSSSVDAIGIDVTKTGQKT